MNFTTQILHLLGSGAAAYMTARQLRDPLTCPDTLAGLQLAEAGAVPFLEALRDRAEAEGDDWLATRLDTHAKDEKRHAQILAHGLKLLNKQVIDFQSLRQTSDTQNKQQRSPFFAAYFEGYPQESLAPEKIDWLVFMASTYILELDASKDFLRMADALPKHEAASPTIRQGILSIAKDETGHAAYLWEAMERRLPYAQVQQLAGDWRTRKVNALLAMVTNLIQKGGKLPSLARDGVPTEMSGTMEAEPELISATAA